MSFNLNPRSISKITFLTESLFGLDLVVGKFDQLISFLANWLKSEAKDLVKNSKFQPLTLMVVSMQDLIAFKFKPQVAEAIKSFDILTPDGMPLVWMARLLGHQSERMYGPDMMEALLKKTANSSVRHFLYGGTNYSLKQLENKLIDRWPNLKIVGSLAPPFRPLTGMEKKEIIRTINAAKPQVLWVGLGSWKQLLWVSEFKPNLKVSLIIPVGMAFDVLAGIKPQAPIWLRNLGGEWLFRLISEPVRLWSRYFWQVPFFAFWWLVELINQWMKKYGVKK